MSKKCKSIEIFHFIIQVVIYSTTRLLQIRFVIWENQRRHDFGWGREHSNGSASSGVRWADRPGRRRIFKKFLRKIGKMYMFSYFSKNLTHKFSRVRKYHHFSRKNLPFREGAATFLVFPLAALMVMIIYSGIVFLISFQVMLFSRVTIIGTKVEDQWKIHISDTRYVYASFVSSFNQGTATGYEDQDVDDDYPM